VGVPIRLVVLVVHIAKAVLSGNASKTMTKPDGIAPATPVRLVVLRMPNVRRMRSVLMELVKRKLLATNVLALNV